METAAETRTTDLSAAAATTTTDPAAGPSERGGSEIVSARVRARVDDLAREFRSARPFPHVVIDGFLEAGLCRRIAAEFPRYDAERFRNEWGELGKAYHEGVAAIGPAFAELDAGLRSQAFLDLLSRISGIYGLLFDPHYFGGGTHENLHGMELDPHIDFNLHPETRLHRRLNLLLYLNETWDDAWGGALELHTNPWLHPAEDHVKAVSPALNRCVVFETSDHSWHGFRRIDLPPDRRELSRRSFAMYLYTRERPGCQLIPHDITIYTDRPLPEHIQPGRTLTREDVGELQTLLARRDRKLEYLYGRAICYAQPTLEAEAGLAERPVARRVAAALFRLKRRARGLLAGRGRGPY
jgi:hypothetical protein